MHMMSTGLQVSSPAVHQSGVHSMYQQQQPQSSQRSMMPQISAHSEQPAYSVSAGGAPRPQSAGVHPGSFTLFRPPPPGSSSLQPQTLPTQTMHHLAARHTFPVQVRGRQSGDNIQMSMQEWQAAQSSYASYLQRHLGGGQTGPARPQASSVHSPPASLSPPLAHPTMQQHIQQQGFLLSPHGLQRMMTLARQESAGQPGLGGPGAPFQLQRTFVNVSTPSPVAAFPPRFPPAQGFRDVVPNPYNQPCHSSQFSPPLTPQHQSPGARPASAVPQQVQQQQQQHPQPQPQPPPPHHRFSPRETPSTTAPSRFNNNQIQPEAFSHPVLQSPRVLVPRETPPSGWLLRTLNDRSGIVAFPPATTAKAIKAYFGGREPKNVYYAVPSGVRQPSLSDVMLDVARDSMRGRLKRLAEESATAAAEASSEEAASKKRKCLSKRNPMSSSRKKASSQQLQLSPPESPADLPHPPLSSLSTSLTPVESATSVLSSYFACQSDSNISFGPNQVAHVPV